MRPYRIERILAAAAALALSFVMAARAGDDLTVNKEGSKAKPGSSSHENEVAQDAMTKGAYVSKSMNPKNPGDPAMPAASGDREQPKQGSKSVSPVDAAARLMTHARCFRALAQADFQSAVTVMADDAFAKRWASESGGIFKDPIAAPAFFEHVFTFLGPLSSNSGYVAFYNVWIDSMIVVRFDKTPAGRKVSEFRLVKGGTVMDEEAVLPSSASTSEMAAGLESRLRNAEARFRSLFTRTGMTPEQAVERKDISTRLVAFMKEGRRLAPETRDKAFEPYRAEMKRVARLIRFTDGKLAKDRGHASETAALTAILNQPVDWRHALAPVCVTSGKDQATLVMAEFTKPGSIVLINIGVERKQAVVKEATVQVIDKLSYPGVAAPGKTSETAHQ